MARSKLVLLADRGVLAIRGDDAVEFLDNLVTSDLSAVAVGAARLAALLTPQGKILFEMLAVRTTDGWLIDTRKDRLADLAKRLTLYKLRAKVVIEDVSDRFVVLAAWDGEPEGLTAGSIRFEDPRERRLGVRLILPSAPGDLPPVPTAGSDAYASHRIGLGVAEGGRDFPLGDTFPHEAGYDRNGGVSFTKGCYVGQEVVARMQHKTIVRKRVVPVEGAGALTAGAELRIGEAVIGALGSTDGARGLALVRLDRAVEAADKGQSIEAGGVAITVDSVALDRYRAAVAAREVGP